VLFRSLDVISTCASARNTLICRHIPAGENAARFYAGYQGNGQPVIHLLPQPGLHLFIQLPDGANLGQEMLSLSGCNSLSPVEFEPFSLSDDAIRNGHSIAVAQGISEAAATWTALGIPSSPAMAVARLLAAPHSMVVFQLGRRCPDGKIQGESMTVLHAKSGAILMQQDGAADLFTFSPLGTKQLVAYLQTWLA